MKKIGITTGDPAGIGPEIVTKSLMFKKRKKNIIYIIFGENYKNILNVKTINSPSEAKSPDILYHIPLGEKIEKGKPSEQSGETAYKILQKVSYHLSKKQLDAIVTAPVAKNFIQKNHPDFIGHTEFFAQNMNIDPEKVIMSFWSETFNLFLLTTHLSVNEAIKKMNYKFLYQKLKRIYLEIKKIDTSPKIAILGINPHAGENGRFGETDEILKKVLNTLKKEAIFIDGPYPADSFFVNYYKNYQYIISGLHDQGLIPFKLINFSEGVNVTLGLPFVRTSPDHGTAFDIADKNIADEKSMLKAIEFAEYLLLKEKNSLSTYSTFAKYYDDYMDHVNYSDWVKFILKKYNEFSDKNLKIIYELACGTANISTILVKKGYKVYASDISSEMLKIAYKKKYKPILFYHDFLTPLPVKNIDLILLIFDSINYIAKKEHILSLFENVYDALNYNGIFIFDISTIKNCQDNFDGFVNLEDNKESYFIHESFFNEQKLISKLTFFEKQGFLYKRKDEKHTQYIYKVENILNLIKKSNLILKGFYAQNKPDINLLKTPLTSEEIDYDYNRLFFILKKEI